MVRCIQCGVSFEEPYKFCIQCGYAIPNEEAAKLPTASDFQGSQPQDFGFSPSDIDFQREGLGAEAASAITERFLPILQVHTGGMGKIFLVQERSSGRYVALKVMHENMVHDRPLVHQFIREAVITARLQHPNVIPVHELGFLERGQLYYTMRYVDGDSFDELAPKLELDERLRILRSSALAVDYAHKQGIWHRDLKPQNILVGAMEETYVIDWGLVSVLPGKEYKLNLPRVIIEKRAMNLPDNLLIETKDAATTHSGVIIGTPLYMSPEQATGSETELGAASDVWAFGIMLFEVLTGRHPIENAKALDNYEALHHVSARDMPAPREYARDAPDNLNALCHRMLSRDLRHRPQDLKGFIKEVTLHLKSHGRTIFTLGDGSKATTGRWPSPATSVNPMAADTEQITKLELENAELRVSKERSEKKLKILTEIAQLGYFEFGRKKGLWAELIKI